MNSTRTKHLMAFAGHEHVREEFKLGDCVNICNRRSILGVWGEKIADRSANYTYPLRESQVLHYRLCICT